MEAHLRFFGSARSAGRLVVASWSKVRTSGAKALADVVLMSRLKARPTKLCDGLRQKRLATVPVNPSGFDPHALPKSDPIFDLLGACFGLRVIPRGVVIPHAVHFDVVIMRGALPRALRRVAARLQKLFSHGIRREILVPFHNDGRAALRDYFPAPACLGHFHSPGAISGFRRFCSPIP